MSDATERDTPRTVSVALPVPLFRAFSYAVPDGAPVPAVGARVVAPFHGRRLVGVVLDVAPPPAGVVPKPLVAVPDEAPALTAPLLETARWIAEWYAAPIGLVVRGMLPVALSRAARPEPPPKARRWAALARELPSLLERERLFARAPQQRVVVEVLEAHGGAMPLEVLRAQADCSPSVITALVKKGLVALSDEAVARDPFAARAGVAPPATPTPAQREAIDAIVAGAPGDTFLLHGVTGSGKTLVYIEVLREIVERRGRSAIVLVPEIALTPQTVDRFRGAFGDAVAVLHSGLSDGERLDAWRALRRGEKRIAVGARSALFAPLADVGVVVVDEEHEGTYKQGETPRYHAREAAIVRARAEGAVVVLGSATPSLETWERARQGKIMRLVLPARATGAEMPDVEVVDLRAVLRAALAGRPPDAPYDETIGVLSPALEAAIRETLARGEQALLLLNRRGYAAFVECRDCGAVVTCPSCSISLTYHRVPEGLVCHYCLHREPLRTSCDACGGPTLTRRGLGTQQVERLVAERFPDARIARMDVDTTSGKLAHASILDRVGAGEIDILLGTQMIAKGLDFPNVTLVGVVDADTGLALPDFRAAERTFHLVHQVAGRAGRGSKPGRVLVQTRRPQHRAIRHAVTHDVEAFLAEELGERRAPAYPPLVRLANVLVSGEDETRTAEAAIATAEWVRALLTARNVRTVEVVGPAPCPVQRIKRRWRWHFLLRTPSAATLTRVARYVAERAPATREPDVRVVVDRDPVSTL